MPTFSGIDGLNYFTRNYPLEVGLVQPDTKLDAPLLEALRPNLREVELQAGAKAEIEIMYNVGLTGGPTSDTTDIGDVYATSWMTGTEQLRTLEVNVGDTTAAFRRGSGMPRSWTNYAVQLLANRKTDWDLTLDQVLSGNGSGLRGIVSSSSYSGGVLTIYLKNNYLTTGWENVARLQVGQRIQIKHSGAAVADSAGTVNFPITGRYFGDRDNGAAVTTGYIKITCASDISASCASDDLIYIKNAVSGSLSEPYGLIALLQGNGDSYAGTSAITTLHGLTRASYKSLQSLVWDATDFASNGVAGTPNDWKLTTLARFINEIKRGNAKGAPDLALCSSRMAQTLAEKQRQERSMQITVNTSTGVGDQEKTVIGIEYATNLRTGGANIDIKPTDSLPDNVIHLIRKEDIVWVVNAPGFHNVASELNVGDVWMPSKGDRKVAIEAPFRGEMQLMVHRLDRCGSLLDLICE